MLVVPPLFSTTVASIIEAAGAATVVVVVAMLFPKYGSTPARETVATFVSVVPATVGTTTMVMVALVAPGTVPRAHVTILPFCEQLPCEETVEVKLTLEGSRFVTNTPVAADGPALLTVRV